ncbi:kinase [Croceicoccus gelatinilyticus]|uniref:kinase n=1 Tax=Croceicoccus gelatinilyticus TaxID=2835536 RepID=UPI001CEDF42A|nr:kinase [Croceicoccus gelatinilyticus]
MSGGGKTGAGAVSAATAFASADAFLVEAIAGARQDAERPVLIGLSGAQGSGKSTTAARLAGKLADRGLATQVCSIDDFYLTKGERAELARTRHPLLATRGVPGTHDVALMNATVSGLLAGEAVRVPGFDKAADDRWAASEWKIIDAPVDIVLLEGWCVGARPQPEGMLAEPVNELERLEDENGDWRRAVNAALAGEYRDFFDRIDLSILLRTPSFAVVESWRSEQERGLDRSGAGAGAAMTPDKLRRFISHYERLTRWQIEDMAADIVIDIDGGRVPRSIRLAERDAPD